MPEQACQAVFQPPRIPAPRTTRQEVETVSRGLTPTHHVGVSHSLFLLWGLPLDPVPQQGATGMEFVPGTQSRCGMSPRAQGQGSCHPGACRPVIWLAGPTPDGEAGQAGPGPFPLAARGGAEVVEAQGHLGPVSPSGSWSLLTCPSPGKAMALSSHAGWAPFQGSFHHFSGFFKLTLPSGLPAGGLLCLGHAGHPRRRRHGGHILFLKGPLLLGSLGSRLPVFFLSRWLLLLSLSAGCFSA